MLDEIKKKHIFGPCLGVVWTIEYQKRGLPHMHLLVFLKTDYNFLTAANVDRIISAELRSEDTERQRDLSAILKSSMVHTQCAGGNLQSICMKDIMGRNRATCCKSYPREFQQETIIQENGYPLYRRRNDDHTFIIRGKGTARDQQITIDNRYVVPYNPYLTWRYKAHVNVEICGSIRAVKYIHKYIYKGGDQATVHLESEKHEVKRYLNGRYIVPTKTIWRLFEFKIHEELPSVKHLAIHLPGEQAIYFPDGLSRDELIPKQHLPAFLIITFEMRKGGVGYIMSSLSITGLLQKEAGRKEFEMSRWLLVECGLQAPLWERSTICDYFLLLSEDQKDMRICEQ